MDPGLVTSAGASRVAELIGTMVPETQLGLFFCRIFLDGIFFGRIFLDGIFLEGIFLDRIFNGGIFLDRIFNGGIFLSGIYLRRIFLCIIFTGNKALWQWSLKHSWG